MSVEISKQEAMDKVTRWLEESGFIYKKVPDPTADLNLNFWSMPTLTIQAIFFTSMQDRFEILMKLSFSNDAYAALVRKKPDDRYKFRRELEYLLLTLNLEYNIIENDAAVMVSKLIYFDDLTKHRFFETVLSVKRAWRMINLKNDELFQESKIKQR
jgi:hypothetical protein